MGDIRTGGPCPTPEEYREYARIRDLIFPVIKRLIGCEKINALARDCEHGTCACANAASGSAGKLVWG